MTTENRLDERYPVSMRVEILASRYSVDSPIETQILKASTLNVSLSGCLLMTTKPVCEQTLWIRLDNKPNSIIECEVVRQLESSIQSMRCYGLKFQQVITPEAFAILIVGNATLPTAPGTLLSSVDGSPVTARGSL